MPQPIDHSADHRPGKRDFPPVAPPKEEARPVLRGQTAIVTGAASGIGRGIALALRHAGANVVINHIEDEDAAAEVIEEAERTPLPHAGRMIGVRADVSREEEVAGLFRRAEEAFGGVDILVNNAGLQRDAPIEEMSLEDWSKVIAVNLTGQFLCAREAVRGFKRRGVRPEVSCSAGKILCVSSVHDIIPWAGHVNYAASKGGVMLMMKTIAQEVAPWRIRVNSICPGAIRTPINRPAWETPEAYEDLMRLVPYKRIGEVDDVARVAVWLCSDESDYIVGANVYVDGGMTLYPGFAHGG